MSIKFEVLNDNIKQIYKIECKIYKLFSSFYDTYNSILFLLIDSIENNDILSFKDKIQYFKTTNINIQNIINFCKTDLQISTLKNALKYTEAYAKIEIKNIIELLSKYISSLLNLIILIDCDSKIPINKYTIPMYNKFNIYDVCQLFNWYNNDILYKLFTEYCINKHGFIGTKSKEPYTETEQQFYIHTDKKVYYGLTNNKKVRAGVLINQSIIYLHQILEYLKKLY